MKRLTAFTLASALLLPTIAYAQSRHDTPAANPPPGIRASAERVRFERTTLGPPLIIRAPDTNVMSKRARGVLAYGLLGVLAGSAAGTVLSPRQSPQGAIVTAEIGGIIGAIAGMHLASR